MPDGRPVQVVFDRSAVAAFVKQSLAVGEVIAVLVDDDVDFGVPVTVLAEASLAASGADADMLNHLVRHVAFVPLGLSGERWTELAAVAERLESVEPAVVLHTAESLDAYVLTAVPGDYAGPDGARADRVIAIEK